MSSALHNANESWRSTQRHSLELLLFSCRISNRCGSAVQFAIKSSSYQTVPTLKSSSRAQLIQLPPQSDNTMPTTFLSLPLEVRLVVYNDVISSNNKITLRIQVDQWDRFDGQHGENRIPIYRIPSQDDLETQLSHHAPIIALLFVSKQVHEDIRPFIYQCLRLHLQPDLARYYCYQRIAKLPYRLITSSSMRRQIGVGLAI